jgi:hypothetical protein
MSTLSDATLHWWLCHNHWPPDEKRAELLPAVRQALKLMRENPDDWTGLTVELPEGYKKRETPLEDFVEAFRLGELLEPEDMEGDHEY